MPNLGLCVYFYTYCLNSTNFIRLGINFLCEKCEIPDELIWINIYTAGITIILHYQFGCRLPFTRSNRMPAVYVICESHLHTSISFWLIVKYNFILSDYWSEFFVFRRAEIITSVNIMWNLIGNPSTFCLWIIGWEKMPRVCRYIFYRYFYALLCA